MAIPNDPGGSTTQAGGGLLGDYTKYEGPMMGPSGYGYYEVTYSGITGQPKSYTLTQSRDLPGSGGGGGSTSYVNIMGGQLGANRYTTYTDDQGNVWQVDNLDGSRSIVQRAASNTNPADRNGDGLDDTTNMALGVYAHSSSPSGYYYPSASGELIPVLPNGAPYTGPDLTPAPPPPAAPRPGTWTGYGPQGQGTYYLDGPNGTPGTFIGRTTNPATTTSGGSSTTTPRATSSGGSSGGGAPAAPPRDWAGEQARQNAFNAAQAEANREFEREMAAAKTETDMAIAEMNFAINLRRLGLDEKKFGVDAAETFGRLASSTDPLAFASFLHAGGGNIMNALSTGADALSSAALLPAARALQAMRGLGSGGAGGGFGTGGFPSYRSPTTGGGGATPTPTDPGAAPPATPPVVAPVTQGGRTVNTNRDPNHGVISWGTNEGGRAIPGYQGYAGNTGQYDVIAGPTMPPSSTLPPPGTTPPPPPQATASPPGGMAGGVQFDSPLPDPPPGYTVYGSEEASRLYNDLYNRPPLPNRAVIPAFANGTMRGLTRAPMMMTGDATGRNPAANGARPEIITNPTGAPLGVIPFPQARQMMRGIPRYAEGTWYDPYKDVYPVAEPPTTVTEPTTTSTTTTSTPAATPTASTPAPSTTTTPTAPASSISDPALQTTTPRSILQDLANGGGTPEQWAAADPNQIARMRGLSGYTTNQYGSDQILAQVQDQQRVGGPQNMVGTAAWSTAYDNATGDARAAMDAEYARVNGLIQQKLAGTGMQTTTGAYVAPYSIPPAGTTENAATPGSAPTPPAPPPAGANVPTGGYGVTPLTDAQLGVTPGDIPGMQEVLGLRQGTQVPNLSYMDIGYWDQLPTLQDLYHSGLQGRYGIPTQDSRAEAARYRMRGLSGGNLALGV